MTKKVVVSGSTGQDGSYMIEYLLRNTDNTVIAAVRRTSQAILDNLKGVLDNPRVKIVTLDLCDGEAIRKLVRDERPDYFINFGAQTFVSDSWSHPVAHMNTNAISLIHILEAVREYVPACRVYSAGSSEQWGDVVYSPQDEKHPYRPRSVYGVSKCAAAMLCKVYRESYGLYVVHGILFNHESERRQDYFVTRKITKGVARIAKAIKEDKSFDPIELGNLDAKRDWSHAEDFVDGVWRMLHQEEYRSVRTNSHQGSDDPVVSRSILHEYILSSGETHSIREFVEKSFRVVGIQTIWGRQNEIERMMETLLDHNLAVGLRLVNGKPDGENPLVVVNPIFYRPAEVAVLHGDSTLARTELGWSPKVSFDELVRRMVVCDMKECGLLDIWTQDIPGGLAKMSKLGS